MLRLLIKKRYRGKNGHTYIIDNIWWLKGEVSHIDLSDDKGKKYNMIELKWLDTKLASGELEPIK
jgi:hypothetical protein